MLYSARVLLVVLALFHCVAGDDGDKDEDIPVNSIALKIRNNAGAPVSVVFACLSTMWYCSYIHLICVCGAD